jgi:ABC-type multidrug transport system, ATPase and permease components
MKEFFQILRRFVPPYKKFLIFNILSNVLSAILNIFSFSLIIPILQILFKLSDQVYKFIPWDADMSMKKIALNNFYYYVTDLIKTYGPSKTLLILGLFLSIMTFMKTGTYILTFATIIPIRTGVVRDIRGQFYKKLLNLPLSFYSEERKGDIMARMSGDVQEIETSIMSSLDMIFKNPILIIMYFGTLLAISWELTLFTIAVLPGMGWLMGTIGKKLKRKSLIAQGQWSDMMSQMEETLGGLRIIKAFNAEHKMDDRFNRCNNEYRHTISRVNTRQQMSGPMSEFLGTVLIVIVLWFGGTLILRNSSTIDAPSFIFYLVILYSLINPLKDFSKAAYSIPKGLASMQRVDKILQAENTMEISENPTSIKDLKDKIVYKDVSFKYESENVLKHINLVIPKGKTIALVGQSGSGKSTLVDLLPRFYDVTEGEILLMV